MGACACTAGESTAERQERLRAQFIEDELAQSMQEEKQLIKLLLLGPGESGKSTLFKQLIHLYGEGYSDDDRVAYTPIVYRNCIGGMKQLLKYAGRFAESGELGDGLKGVSEELEESVELVNTLLDTTPIDVVLAKHIRLLWEDAAVQRTFEMRSKFQLNESCRYFFGELERISQPDYVPTLDDMLRCRARTTGVVENTFAIEGNRFLMVDVGGQRNERRKWIHCFEDVTAMIFVAALSEFDQVLYEDGTTNRMEESLRLFHDMCNSMWFSETSVLLFLNKRDLFREKIEDMNLYVGDYMPGYDGPAGDCDAAFDYIRDEFLAQNERADQGKQIYWHPTCATDTSNIKFTFDACKDILMKNKLTEVGLLH